MTMLYKSLVRTRAEYGAVAWSRYHQKDTDQIERMTNSFGWTLGSAEPGMKSSMK